MKQNLSKRGRGGYTLQELLLVICFLFILALFFFFWIGVIIMGNQWFTNDGVLNSIKLVDTNAANVVTYERNVLRKSVIVVREKDGSLKKFSLDSDVLLNYVVKPMDRN
jgi:competence protein ComGC